MDKRLKYATTCQKNPEYPKVRLVCGDFEFILNKGDGLVRVEEKTVKPYVVNFKQPIR